MKNRGENKYLDQAQQVRQILRDMLKNADTRGELAYLVGLAEETGAFTHAMALSFVLAHVDADPAARANGETAESYVQRVMKFLISKESPEGTALAIEDIMMRVSDLRGIMSLEAALTEVVENA